MTHQGNRTQTGVAAALLLALAPSTSGRATIAQDAAGGDARSLMQIELNSGPGLAPADDRARLEAFVAATRTITSCAQAVAVGTRFKAGFFMANVPFERVPPPLRKSLLSKPIGHAYVPFGRPGDPIRVLVLCPASFSLPAELNGKPPPAS